MLKINGRWYLDSDSMQFIIYEKTISKSGKTAGQEVFTPKAFCGNLFQVKNWLFNQEIKDNVELLNNIEERVKLSNSIDGELYGSGSGC